MKTALTLSLLVLARSFAAAQEVDYQKLEVYHASTVGKTPCPCGEKGWNGSRIEITLRNLNTLKGFLIDPHHNAKARVKPKKLDFTQEKSLTVDISLDYISLDGTVTVPKGDIRSVRILEKLDEATLRRLQAEKEKHQIEIERLTREHEARIKAQESEEERARQAAAEEEALHGEQLTEEEALAKKKEALDLYNKFPESAGWGQEKVKEIQNKVLNRQQPTMEEQEFLRSYDLWTTGKKFADEKKSRNESKPDEAPPKE